MLLFSHHSAVYENSKFARVIREVSFFLFFFLFLFTLKCERAQCMQLSTQKKQMDFSAE